MTQLGPTVFDTRTMDALGVDLTLPEESLFPELFVKLEVDLLSPGDGIITDRHHASRSHFDADDRMSQIGGTISPFALSGWLRRGCEEIVQLAGGAVCHPGEAAADPRPDDVYERDFDAGYHENGSCVDDDAHHEDGCVVFDVFGGFGDRPGNLLRYPVRFSPVRSDVDVLDGEPEAHYRSVTTQVRSRNGVASGQRLRMADRDLLGHIEGTWRLRFRALRPAFVGLVLHGIEYMDRHSDEYAVQLGGTQSFGCRIADVSVVNPLYSPTEVRRVVDRSLEMTQEMRLKDERWREAFRAELTRALQHRIQDSDDLGDPLETEESA